MNPSEAPPVQQLSDAIITGIKNDDPSVIDISVFERNDSIKMTSYEYNIIKYDAIKCMSKVKNYIVRHSINSAAFQLCISKRMSYLLLDCHGVSYWGYPVTFDTLIDLKKNTNVNFGPEFYLTELSFLISQNDIRGVSYILDTIASFMDISGSLSQNIKDISPDMFLYLLSRGIHNGPPVVPSSFLEQNLIDLIDKLINEYHFILDFSALGMKSISNMIKNNAFEATKMVIQYGAADKYISAILNECALFNCDEMLQMVINEASSKFSPGCANKSLISAAKLGRTSIFRKLLIPSAIDLKTVEEARKEALDGGFVDIVKIIDTELPEGIPEETFKFGGESDGEYGSKLINSEMDSNSNISRRMMQMGDEAPDDLDNLDFNDEGYQMENVAFANGNFGQPPFGNGDFRQQPFGNGQMGNMPQMSFNPGNAGNDLDNLEFEKSDDDDLIIHDDEL
ncbi:hypothetical protein TVAG_402170 [Trichomonas vaginalis G3]|uniref:Uncharacterized protein n=1 Tax=Trichomonas vaginalis (strain ATCC PRA-98 / G3) TaxID=412133 RepID=A2DHX4_TRIV3|nr:hypothetical protein TVAGG3_0271680 [Trichomonas vaginalis G3]EAY19963.1 hypothetical protein TVAG_402170 [Trichomonas vaginalis G3]KAI5525913.1 hypothetical protein TVAGG3_0271680 [Trichomonas vaginalis G3]|eukprot:XP_001580949.1 hypothetical protein [Trichomonas vaginalis G3]